MRTIGGARARCTSAPAGDRDDRDLGPGPQGPAAVETCAIDGPPFREERPAPARHPGVFELDARGRELLGREQERAPAEKQRERRERPGERRRAASRARAPPAGAPLAASLNGTTWDERLSVTVP